MPAPGKPLKPIDAARGRCDFCDETERVTAISEASGRRVTICEDCAVWALDQITAWCKLHNLLGPIR